MAVVLEVICGWLGFLGVGYLVRGYIGTGLGLMVLWWLVIGSSVFVGIITLGANAACFGPALFVVPIISAVALANRAR
jgi:hypothetical protein